MTFRKKRAYFGDPNLGDIGVFVISNIKYGFSITIGNYTLIHALFDNIIILCTRNDYSQENSRFFPGSQNSSLIPGFHDQWPPWTD